MKIEALDLLLRELAKSPFIYVKDRLELVLALLSCFFLSCWFAFIVLYKRRDRASNTLTWYYRFLANGRNYFIIVFCLLFMRASLYEPYYVIESDLAPSLIAGDFAIINKHRYGFRLPIASDYLMHLHDPKRGDLVIFRRADDPGQSLIARVAGLPNERIVIHSTKGEFTADGDQMNFYFDVKKYTFKQDNAFTKSLGDNQYLLLLDALSPQNPLDAFVTDKDQIFGRVERIFFNWDKPGRIGRVEKVMRRPSARIY